MHITFYPFELKLADVFALAGNSRTTTDIIVVEIEHEGVKGYGEASFPPYMKEKRGDNLAFLATVDLSRYASNFNISAIGAYLDGLSPANNPAKAAIDMALYDLRGKLIGEPVYTLLGIENNKPVYTSFTLGLGDDAFIAKQLLKAKNFKVLKVKLGSDISHNKHTVELIQSITKQPFGVDFNQGLTDRNVALDMINWLAAKGVLYAEQPLPDGYNDDYVWLRANSPLDIFGDESIQNAQDIKDKAHLFTGVNIKLMKCGGITKALQMFALAKKLGLKTMLGCMAESSCAVTAAAHISPLFDKVDLDGNLLLANDPFTGALVQNGQLVIPNQPGLGINKITS